MAFCATLLEEYLLCPVCREIFRDPVLLMCSHSFCRICLDQYWQHSKSDACPLCRASSSVDQLPCNLTLKNLCEAFIKEKHQRSSNESTVLCKLHNKKLTHYCLEDKQIVCEECQTLPTHTNHFFRLIDEAAVDLKMDLKRKLSSLNNRLTLFRNLKLTCIQTNEYIKSQSFHTEAQIRNEFEKLHQFLWDEEVTKVAALRKEEEEKTQIVIKKIKEMNEDILSLSDKILALEDGIEANNISFLQNYEATLKRSCYELKDPEVIGDSLINVAQHLGNLKFKVWQKMQHVIQYTPVTLDPNTAHPYLYLSDELTKVEISGFQSMDTEPPANPERFTDYTSVVGSEGFGSGTHSWDTEVGDSTAWAVGVITESAYKQRHYTLSKHNLWHVGYYRGNYGHGISDDMLTPLKLKGKLQRIRILLDWDGGRLSFFDPVSNTHVHTFVHTFTEPVYPYFCNACPEKALRILPIEISLTEEWCDK